MLTKSQKEIIFGVVILVTGVVYFALTTQLPRKGSVDSATVPYFLSSLMIVLGIIHIVTSAKMHAPAPAPESEEGAAKPDAPVGGVVLRRNYLTVALTGLLIFLYVAFLEYLGFPLMSALYLFFQISLLTPAYQKKKYLYYALVSVGASVAIYYIFLLSFDLLLPSGDLWYNLGWV